ncbi:MAG: MarR family winged helix-turn-helix transcriptional regulator [Thermoplasmata archaeon]
MSEEGREFVVALEGLMECFQQEQRGLFRDWRLTPVQFFVLRWLSKDQDANMSTLAWMLGVRPQTVTPIVDSLEKGGWVRRVRSREDRREALLRLTPKGSRLLRSIRASFVEKLGHALDAAPATSLRTASAALRIATASLGRDRPRSPGAPSRSRGRGRTGPDGVR